MNWMAFASKHRIPMSRADEYRVRIRDQNWDSAPLSKNKQIAAYSREVQKFTSMNLIRWSVWGENLFYWEDRSYRNLELERLRLPCRDYGWPEFEIEHDKCITWCSAKGNKEYLWERLLALSHTSLCAQLHHTAWSYAVSQIKQFLHMHACWICQLFHRTHNPPTPREDHQDGPQKPVFFWPVGFTSHLRGSSTNRDILM